MDSEFIDDLSKLQEAMAGPVSDELVVAHVAAIDEAIVALHGIKDGFKECSGALAGEKAELEVVEAKCRIAAINTELKAMGGEQLWHNMYSSIPKDAIDSKEYFAHVDAMERNMEEIVLKKRTIEQERGEMVILMPTVYEQKIECLDKKLGIIQEEEDKINASMLLYLEHNRPFYAAPYLKKKRGLLNEKLELLKRVRRAEEP